MADADAKAPPAANLPAVNLPAANLPAVNLPVVNLPVVNLPVVNPRGAPASDARLAAIYQDIILDHYRRPRGKGALDAPAGTPTLAAERRNPLCGDEVSLQLALDGDVVREARFTGQGCSISQASASMLTQAVRGKTRAEAEALVRRFVALAHGDADAAADKAMGELRAMQGVARFPARIRCATLAWGALDDALKAGRGER